MELLGDCKDPTDLLISSNIDRGTGSRAKIAIGPETIVKLGRQFLTCSTCKIRIHFIHLQS